MSNPDPPPSDADRSSDEPFQREVEGRAVAAHAGDTVASALIAAGVQVLSRSLKFHRPRTVFCLSGSCGYCLLRIDGRPNTRACQVKAEPGMRCARQNAWPSADYDLLAAADAMFPLGSRKTRCLTSWTCRTSGCSPMCMNTSCRAFRKAKQRRLLCRNGRIASGKAR